MAIDPIIGGAVIGGISSIIGNIIGNNQSAASVDKQIAFQERMSNTSYQRAMDDMRKAGLNPMLAYSQGGASSPQGANYQAQNVLEGVPSAMKMATLEKVALENQIRATNKEIDKKDSEIQLNDETKNLQKVNQVVATENARATALQNQINTINLPAIIQRAKLESDPTNAKLKWLKDLSGPMLSPFFGGAASGKMLGEWLKEKLK